MEDNKDVDTLQVEKDQLEFIEAVDGAYHAAPSGEGLAGALYAAGLAAYWVAKGLSADEALVKALGSHATYGVPQKYKLVPISSFDPENHHNALLCPHCNPESLKFEAQTVSPNKASDDECASNVVDIQKAESYNLVPSLDCPLKEFRVVTIQHTTKTKDHMPYRKSYMIHQSDVNNFITACLALHYDPGVNPVTKGQTLPVEAIFLEEFESPKSYWWCQPHLGQVPGETGAKLFEAPPPYMPYWASPAYEARMETEKALYIQQITDDSFDL